MRRECPACGYVRKEVEAAPAWQCPACKIAYNKARGDGRYLDPEMEQYHQEIKQAKEQERAEDDAIYEELYEYGERTRYWIAGSILAFSLFGIVAIKLLGRIGYAFAGVGMIVAGLFIIRVVRKAKANGTFGTRTAKGRLSRKADSPVEYYFWMFMFYLGGMFFILWGLYYIYRVLMWQLT